MVFVVLAKYGAGIRVDHVLSLASRSGLVVQPWENLGALRGAMQR